jgi:hypothetical protein
MNIEIVTKPVSRQVPKEDATIPLAIGAIGSLVMMTGVFAPFLRSPANGSVDYFRGGAGIGVFMLAAGVAAIVLVVINQRLFLFGPGCVGLCLLAYSFLDFQQKIGAAKLKLETKLTGNPFKGLAEASINNMGFDWGFYLLAAGCVAVIAAALIPAKRAG